MSTRHAGGRRFRRWTYGGLAALAVVLAMGLGLVWLAQAPRPAPGTAVARRETRRTLDPAEFLGKAARAYQVAREIPDVLDQLRCYCECDRLYGHETLLSCYTDRHANT